MIWTCLVPTSTDTATAPICIDMGTAILEKTGSTEHLEQSGDTQAMRQRSVISHAGFVSLGPSTRWSFRLFQIDGGLPG